MPISNRQLNQYLFTTTLHVKKTILKSGKQPTDKSDTLFNLVNARVDQHFVEGSGLFFAFNFFINLLDEQKLSKEQLSKAIERFSELPDISDALRILHNNVLEEYRLKITPPSTKKDASEVLMGTSPLSATMSDEADEDDSRSGFYASGSSGAAESYDASASSAAAAISYGELLLSSGQPFKQTFNQERLITQIEEWVNDRYSLIDEREYRQNDRHIRRMDSLSRLLATQSSLSAVLSVTIDVSKDPHLIIGANIDEDGFQEKVILEVSTKLQIIQAYLTELQAIAPRTFNLEMLDSSACELKNRLLSRTKTHFPHDVLEQAAKKIIHAVLLDDSTFTPEEKYALMNQHTLTIILSKINPKGGYLMDVSHINRGSLLKNEYPLTKVPPHASINNIHAEQLIAHFLFEILKTKTDSTYTFGISKLCCGTCKDCLSEYPVLFRGTHNQTYQGVVHLGTGRLESASKERRATTHAWKSPHYTPDPPAHRSTTGDLRAKMMSGTRLLFDHTPEASRPDERASSRDFSLTDSLPDDDMGSSAAAGRPF